MREGIRTSHSAKSQPRPERRRFDCHARGANRESRCGRCPGNGGNCAYSGNAADRPVCALLVTASVNSTYLTPS